MHDQTAGFVDSELIGFLHHQGAVRFKRLAHDSRTSAPGWTQAQLTLVCKRKEKVDRIPLAL